MDRYDFIDEISAISRLLQSLNTTKRYTLKEVKGWDVSANPDGVLSLIIQKGKRAGESYLKININKKLAINRKITDRESINNFWFDCEEIDGLQLEGNELLSNFNALIALEKKAGIAL
jgi:hypothetical protein